MILQGLLLSSTTNDGGVFPMLLVVSMGVTSGLQPKRMKGALTTTSRGFTACICRLCAFMTGNSLTSLWGKCFY